MKLEIKETISRLKKGKATGLDQIPNEVLKCDKLLPYLCKFFNMCFDFSITPTCWSQSITSPVPKGSMTDKYVPLQYRGISLLSCVYKLYSALLNKRLYSFLDAQDWFDDAQHGFRSGRSCEDHIFSLISQIRHGIDNSGSVFCCYIDFQKAFDFLDRNLLLLKLLRAGVDGKIYLALKNTFAATSSCIRLNHRLSENFTTGFGTRQGDPISPTNFSIFINDLLTDLRRNKSDHDSVVCNVLAYADDIVLISETELDLQRLINIVHRWCVKYRLLVNIDKTKVVHYRKIDLNRTKMCFTWEDSQIGIVSGYKYLGVFLDEFLNFDKHCEAIVSGYKYLGVFLDEFLNFDKHCEAICNSAGRALGAIISKFSYFRNIGIKTFDKLFTSNVESVMSYMECQVLA